MAIANFYMVYIKKDSNVTNEQVEEKMNFANDWYRVRSDLWIIYSTSNPDKWSLRLSSFVQNNGNLFVCKLEVDDRQGWMSKTFWSWINREDRD